MRVAGPAEPTVSVVRMAAARSLGGHAVRPIALG